MISIAYNYADLVEALWKFCAIGSAGAGSLTCLAVSGILYYVGRQPKSSGVNRKTAWSKKTRPSMRVVSCRHTLRHLAELGLEEVAERLYSGDGPDRPNQAGAEADA
jgi:hypothetical protein